MWQVLFSYLVCTFEMGVNFYMLSFFLKRKAYNWKSIAPVLAGLAVILLGANRLVGVFWINSITTISLTYFISVLFFEGQTGKRLLLSFAASCISILSELLTAFAASSFLADGFTQHMAMGSYIPFFTIISKLVQYSTIRILILLAGKTRVDTDTRESFILLLCPVLAIVNIYFLMYLDTGRQTHKVEHFFIFALGVGWLILSVIIIWIYTSALEKRYLANQIKIMELQKSAAAEHSRRQKMNERILRQIMHDLKNQLINARGLLTEDFQQGTDYLDAVIGSLGKRRRLAITADYQNTTLNQILNKNQDICEQFGIELKLQIEYDDFSFLNVLDTSAILDNAFDNAVAACGQIPKEGNRYIHLRIWRQGDMLNIVMKNSCRKGLLVNNSKVSSTKLDGQDHGLGIDSMKKAALKYKGMAQVRASNGEFELVMSLNINCE